MQLQSSANSAGKKNPSVSDSVGQSESFIKPQSVFTNRS